MSLTRALMASLLFGPVVAFAQAAPLTVCMAEDNPPFSMARKGKVTGFDVKVAEAVARELGRELKLVPFEPEVEKESMLTHEVNAMLSAGLCDLASGFPLLASDLGPPSRERFKTPDHPGAKPPRERPWITLGNLVPSQPYQGTALVIVQRAGEPPVSSLGELKGRRIGAVAGTLEGTLVAMYGGGALAKQMVSLGQRDDFWAALEGGQVDAMMVPSAAFDAYRVRKPGATLQAGPAKPLGINLGWVALSSKTDLLAVVDRVVARASDSGELQAWAREAGLSWQAPSLPAVAVTLSLAGLLKD
ncbi:substrate-binding periplasmic protein [Hydrogenophaga sp. RWCD_12]|uniref:substrate-binding periplasmic protein n=1 Tax=Hydrogenophaga sp. RWCD_12 TaxID=3391190 RepID=UPI0039846730